MIATLLIASVILLVVIIFQLGRISDLVTTLQDERQADHSRNNVNGWLMLGLGAVFLGLIIWSIFEYQESFLPPSASEHGVWVDNLFNITLVLTGIVFLATQIMLFYFAFRYRSNRKSKKAFYYPENDKLEIAWTIIPAIVLTGLIVWGAFRWYQITKPAPKDAYVIEATGKQFNWIFRYPGEDGELGRHNFKTISLVNKLGLLKKDKAAHDDIITSTLHLPVNRPVKIKIRSRDVLHSFYLPHFRVKMDAVPGIPTTFWFKPKFTTKEMRQKTGNEEFNFELACAELCGKGHSSMKSTVVVQQKDSLDQWLKKQTTWEKTMKSSNKWEGLVQKQEEKMQPKHQKGHHGNDAEGHADRNSENSKKQITSL